jgi:pre-mRNA-splicing factor ATP-dependent RNA helicase DHX16
LKTRRRREDRKGSAERWRELWVVAMGDDKETRIWVGDQLHDLLGFNMPAIVSFVVGLAKKASSAQQLVTDLQNNQFPSSPNTVTFAEDLFNRVPHKKTGLNAYQQAEKSATAFVTKQQQYQLLDADDEDDEEDVGVAAAAAASDQRKESRRKHHRRKREDEVDEDEVLILVRVLDVFSLNFEVVACNGCRIGKNCLFV